MIVFRPITSNTPIYCIVCGEKASHFAHDQGSVLAVCPECREDMLGSEFRIPFFADGKPRRTPFYNTPTAFWAMAFAILIFLATLKAIELIDPPVVPPPIPLIGERFTEHEKDHLTLLSQIAAQDLLDQSLLPENERDLEGEERIANAMRWAESHSNSPFANQ